MARKDAQAAAAVAAPMPPVDRPVTQLPEAGAVEENRDLLQASDERFRLFVQSVSDYALFMLDPIGRVAGWNAGAEKIKGYRSEEIVGEHFSRFYTEEDLRSGKPERELAIATETGRYEEEGWRVRKDGTLFWASVVITALRDEGRLVGFGKVTRDLTERRQAEEEIRRLNEGLEQRVRERTAQLEEANRELEAFSYSISHDLRAPLRVMQGMAHALHEDYGNQLDEEGAYYVERIRASANRLDTLIQDILAYSRLRQEEMELHPTDLHTVIRDALSSLQAELQERQTDIHIQEPLPHVLAHRATLIQVLSNLIGNAHKFVSDGTRPRVCISAEVRDGPRLGAKGVVRLWVEDNGIGIAPEHQTRIFGVFERLHGQEQYPGTGIGLAIVRKGMERMEGRVGVDSAPGQGSRFWIELQRAGDR